MWGEMIDVDKALLQHIASPVRVFSARDSLLYGYCSTDRYRKLCAKKQSKFKSILNYFFLFSFIILLCNSKASVCYATITCRLFSIPKLPDKAVTPLPCGVRSTSNSVAMRWYLHRRCHAGYLQLRCHTGYLRPQKPLTPNTVCLCVVDPDQFFFQTLVLLFYF